VRRINKYAAFSLVGILAGGLLPAILYGFANRAVLSGMVVGLVVALTLAWIENSSLSERFRRMPFLSALIVRTLIQIVVVAVYCIVLMLLLRMITTGLSAEEAYQHPNSQHFLFGGDLVFIILYAVTASFLINMIRQMSRMLGQNVLLNMMIGKYSRPVEEDRIFMFLDLDASTTLAERLGNIRFHELIDDYIYDITPAISDAEGEIYQYVGDEIVVTWKLGPRNIRDNCLECFFSISHKMEALAPKYQQKYGFVPGFKAGLHFGSVIAGQIGDIKKEIVFQGDVVNTASRIKEKCHSLGAKILISRELLDILPKETIKYKAERVGSFLLKGKEHEVELYSVAEG
jgi:class 3 adenylate cyclase